MEALRGELGLDWIASRPVIAFIFTSNDRPAQAVRRFCEQFDPFGLSHSGDNRPSRARVESAVYFMFDNEMARVLEFGRRLIDLERQADADRVRAMHGIQTPPPQS
jgi:hypothetical protein